MVLKVAVGPLVRAEEPGVIAIRPGLALDGLLYPVFFLILLYKR